MQRMQREGLRAANAESNGVHPTARGSDVRLRLPTLREDQAGEGRKSFGAPTAPCHSRAAVRLLGLQRAEVLEGDMASGVSPPESRRVRNELHAELFGGGPLCRIFRSTRMRELEPPTYTTRSDNAHSTAENSVSQDAGRWQQGGHVDIAPNGAVSAWNDPRGLPREFHRPRRDSIEHDDRRSFIWQRGV